LEPGRREVLLADELFWLAHQDMTGRPLLHRDAMGLGLAAALIGELVFSNRLALSEGRVHVLEAPDPADPLARSTMDRIAAEREPLDVRSWLAFLGRDARSAVGRRLVGRGAATCERSAWRRPERYIAYDTLAGARVANPLYLALTRGAPLDLWQTTLAGLADAVGLSRTVLFDGGAVAVRALRQWVDALPAALHELVVQTDAAVGDAVLAHHR
jgi:Golgi phosphoprotein 3 (GPP34)